MTEREEYTDGQTLWQQGDESDCAKLLVRGELIAYTDAEGRTNHAVERVPAGNIVGELGENQSRYHYFMRCHSMPCRS